MNNIDAFLDYFAVINASNEAEVKEMDNGLIRVTIKVPFHCSAVCG